MVILSIAFCSYHSVCIILSVLLSVLLSIILYVLHPVILSIIIFVSLCLSLSLSLSLILSVILWVSFSPYHSLCIIISHSFSLIHSLFRSVDNSLFVRRWQVNVLGSLAEKMLATNIGLPPHPQDLPNSAIFSHSPTKTQITCPKTLRSSSPDLPYFFFLAFFSCKEFLDILSVLPSFPRILGVRLGRNILVFAVVFLAFYRQSKEAQIRLGLDHILGRWGLGSGF